MRDSQRIEDGFGGNQAWRPRGHVGGSTVESGSRVGASFPGGPSTEIWELMRNAGINAPFGR